MAFEGATFSKLFNWDTDPVRAQKIFEARLEAEFSGAETALSFLAGLSLSVSMFDSVSDAVTAASVDGGTLLFRGTEDASSTTPPTNVLFEHLGPAAVGLFGNDDIHAHHFLHAQLPFQASSGSIRRVADAIHVVADGSELNGPANASFAKTVSIYKKDFGTGNAPRGEIDGFYIQVRQDSPRDGDISDFNTKADGCAILMDVATFDDVGFVGGMEGAMSILDPDTFAITKEIDFQIGICDTVSDTSFGYYATAKHSPVTYGLLLTSAESGSGYFENFIYCNTDSKLIFALNRNGEMTLGNRPTSSDTATLRVNTSGNFSILNTAKDTELLSLEQDGDLSVAGAMISASSFAVGNSALQAKWFRLDPAASGFPMQGAMYIDSATGKLKICEDGVNFRTVTTT